MVDLNFRKKYNNFTNDIKLYLSNYRFVIFSCILIAILCYGYEISNFTLSIDEELYILSNKESINAWLLQGRFGIWIFKSIFMELGMFQPFVSSFIAGTFILISTQIWNINLVKINKSKEVNKYDLVIFSGIYMSLPTVISTFMSFSSYNIEVSVGMLLVAISIYFAINFIFEETNIEEIFISVVFLTIAISIYQAFSVVYITGICILFYCKLLDNNYKFILKDLIKKVCISICILFISIIFYKFLDLVLRYIFINGQKDTYTNNFISWLNYDIQTSFYRMQDALRTILNKNNPNVIYIHVSIYMLIALTAIKAILYRNTKSLILIIVGFVLIISPFLMIIVLGGYMPYRSMLALPLFIGFILFIINNAISKKNKFKILVSLISFIIMFNQIQSLNQIFYTENLRYNRDREIASSIIEDIIFEYGQYPQDIPVLFVGAYNLNNIDPKIKFETIGASFFEWDGGNNGRILNFMKVCGYNLIPYENRDKNNFIMNEVDSMNSWPSKNSIKIIDNEVIIVKLSEISEQWIGVNGFE